MGLLGFELLFRLAWGSLFALLFVSRSETSERFVRIWWRFHLGLSVALLFMIWGQSSVTPAWKEGAFLATMVGLAGATLYSLFQARAARLVGALLIVASPWFYGPHHHLGHAINFLSSSLVLGPIFMGQFLGHWFLNVPNVHIRELMRITLFIIAGLVVKLSELVWNLATFTPRHVFSIDNMGRPLAEFVELDAVTQLGALGEGMLGLGFFGQIVLVSRILWGVVAPLVLAFLVYRTVKMRSTQSATGILYAMCVMVLIGEGCALYLLIHAGLYL
ncbi:MAG TPA: hypothetical protein VM901_10305 [Bdellovibrionota bacterium]|jgi:hypothetical protein|nr:hypothetical protein [Bdellovibrionota bacterium]